MNARFLYIILFFASLLMSNLYAQQDTLFSLPSEKNRQNETGGLNAYYFWEEDSLQFIDNKNIDKVFKSNYSIYFQNYSYDFDELETLEKAVFNFANDNGTSNVKERFIVKKNGKDQKVIIPLKREISTSQYSVIFRKTDGTWKSDVYKNVIYIHVYADSSRKFSHANDSVVLKTKNIQVKANGHYIVKQFWNSSSQLVDEQVFAFNGENVSSYFTDTIKPQAKHIIVFSNGYRGPKRNKDASDNLITKKDRFHYWLRLDKAFVNRIKPDDYYYIDGNNSIKTSNHRSMANFSLSYSRIKALRKKDRNKYEYHLLNTVPNDSGFFYRKEQGKLAALAYLNLKCNSPACLEVKDTLDIVSHSMGYAYSLGFIENVKDYVVFRNCYIIAPENASTGGTDWRLFQEVWQYGSNLGQANSDPVWRQDGIAPQFPVKGIESVTNGGRLFFPEGTKHLNFIKAHMLNHYRWIFTDIKVDEKGYVKP